MPVADPASPLRGPCRNGKDVTRTPDAATPTRVQGIPLKLTAQIAHHFASWGMERSIGQQAKRGNR
jgi:hypothetical protein